MKKLFLPIIGVLAIVSFSFAQTIEINEAPRIKDNGTYNSFLFELADVTKDKVEKDWGKFISSYKSKGKGKNKLKTKYDRKSKIHVTTNATIPQLSSTPITVYARILEDKKSEGLVSVIVWFDLGDDQYVDSRIDNIKGSYARLILIEYAMSTSKKYAESVVKQEEDQLSELERELKKLKKNNKGYHAAIEKAKDTIAKNEKDIEINVADQKSKEEEMEAQKITVEDAKEKVKKFIN